MTLALPEPFPLTSYPFLKEDNRTGELAERGRLDRGSRSYTALTSSLIQIRVRLLPFPKPTAPQILGPLPVPLRGWLISCCPADPASGIS